MRASRPLGVSRPPRSILTAATRFPPGRGGSLRCLAGTTGGWGRSRRGGRRRGVRARRTARCHGSGADRGDADITDDVARHALSGRGARDCGDRIHAGDRARRPAVPRRPDRRRMRRDDRRRRRRSSSRRRWRHPRTGRRHRRRSRPASEGRTTPGRRSPRRRSSRSRCTNRSTGTRHRQRGEVDRVRLRGPGRRRVEHQLLAGVVDGDTARGRWTRDGVQLGPRVDRRGHRRRRGERIEHDELAAATDRDALPGGVRTRAT